MPVLIIAEAGVNHNGNLDLARRLVDAAAAAGADVVKFQTSNPDESVAATAPKAPYQHRAVGGEGTTQLEMLRRLRLDENAHRLLSDHCRERRIEFLSSPFYSGGVDLLADRIGVRRLKIGSGEIVNAPLLLKAARTGLPVILSTGMSTLEDIERALSVLAFGYVEKSANPSPDAFRAAFQSTAGKAALADKVTLLHCITEYPAPFRDVNLRAMATLRDAFGLPVGFSDHTPGIEAAVAAVALGAVAIEKHITLDRTLPGPDHLASLLPGEFGAMVSAIRHVEESLGVGEKIVTPSERDNLPIARKSLVAGTAIRKGEVFSETNVAIKRPGTGLSPFFYWSLLGRRAQRDYAPDDLLAEDL